MFSKHTEFDTNYLALFDIKYIYNMSDDEKEVDGELNPDLLEAGLDDEPALDGDDVAEDDGTVPLSKLIDDEEEEGAESDSFDDVEREDKLW